MTPDLPTKLRLLAQDIDDAALLIGHVETRRELARVEAAPAAAPARHELGASPDIPAWARPGAAPLSHWQQFGLTYLFVGVVAFTSGALLLIARAVASAMAGLATFVVTFLVPTLGLLALAGLAILLATLCSGGQRFTFQGTGRLFR